MKLQVYPLSLPGVMLIRSARTSDARGFFAETYVKKDFAHSGICTDFMQDTNPFQFQRELCAACTFRYLRSNQSKLIRVLRGKIFDVVVDLHRSSATYGKHSSVELSAEGGE
jgi:dTDP-4-dehydrorhamnose 3,5-epimerase